jgi:DNA (cytosine-5)-methyltransferase 1
MLRGGVQGAGKCGAVVCADETTKPSRCPVRSQFSPRQSAGATSCDVAGQREFYFVNYYNEFDPYAAQWLRNLITAGLIPAGDVDERSIVEVAPADLAGYRQCHFFAGIGGWSLALRLAGWDDDRPVWTASLPCQPFSVASVAPKTAARGQADERHLLPNFLELVGQCRPARIFGEQVRNAIKWGWLDEAFGALEAIDYACGAVVMPALAVGARHERKRIYWMADAGGEGRQGHQPIECVSVATSAPLAIYGDPLAGARRALDGDYSNLLPSDGLSVVMERAALKGYGNAIVPQVAAEFIGAYMEAA